MKNAGPKQEANLGEAVEFMRLLWSIDHTLQRTSKQMDKNLGVTGPQRLVIRILGSRPGTSAGDVARILRIHPSTLTGILKRLEQRKIIRKAPDPNDARRIFLHLSGLGETLNSVRAGTVEEAVERALGKLSTNLVSGARCVLETLVAELEAGLPADHGTAGKPGPTAGRKRRKGGPGSLHG